MSTNPALSSDLASISVINNNIVTSYPCYIFFSLVFFYISILWQVKLDNNDNKSWIIFHLSTNVKKSFYIKDNEESELVDKFF